MCGICRTAWAAGPAGAGGDGEEREERGGCAPRRPAQTAGWRGCACGRAPTGPRLGTGDARRGFLRAGCTRGGGFDARGASPTWRAIRAREACSTRARTGARQVLSAQRGYVCRMRASHLAPVQVQDLGPLGPERITGPGPSGRPAQPVGAVAVLPLVRSVVLDAGDRRRRRPDALSLWRCR